MYLINYIDEECHRPWLAFKTLHEAHLFIEQLPGYHKTISPETGVVEAEWLDPSELPTYTELTYNGHRIPLSRSMFRAPKRVDLYITPIPNLSNKGKGMVSGATLVDAYMIPNKEVAHYIHTREERYEEVRKVLQAQGLEVDRAFQGSEDGEAICYRRQGETDWHFLGHMDPLFVELKEEEIPLWIADNLPNTDQ